MTAPNPSALAAVRVVTSRPQPPLRSRAFTDLVAARARTESQYLREAFVHPANIGVITLPLALAVLSQTAWILVPGLLFEAAFVGVLSKLRPFRKRVDVVRKQIEREAAAAARAEIHDRIGEQSRRELHRLETLVDRIHGNVELPAEEGEDDDDFLGLHRLLASYIELAITHKTRRQALGTTDRDALAAEIGRLTATRETATSRMRPLVERRLSLARRRAQVWDQNRETLDVIENQLSTVSALIHLLHERSYASLDVHTVSDQIDRFVAELDDHESAIAELGELAGPHPVQDADTPRLEAASG